MADIDLLSAQLTAIVIESAVYGMFLILFVGCMYSLLHKRRHTKVSVRGGPNMNWPMLSATLTLFAAITAHWIIDIRRLFLAFVLSKEGALDYYANLSDPLDLARSGLYIFQCLVGDSIMVYRLWVVWNHNKAVILLPVCSVFGLIVAGSGIVIQLHRLKPGEDLFGSSSGRFITSAFVLTLLTNIYSTSMISFKIWSVNKAIRRMGSGNLTSIIIIIAESAAVYTAFAFMSLTTYLAKSNIQFALIDVTSPIIGLVFCLIIVRVTQGLSFNAFDTRTVPGPGSSTTATSWSTGNGTARPQDVFQMTPIRVNVQRHVDIGDGGKDASIPASEQKDDEAKRHSSSFDTDPVRSQFECV